MNLQKIPELIRIGLLLFVFAAVYTSSSIPHFSEDRTHKRRRLIIIIVLFGAAFACFMAQIWKKP